MLNPATGKIENVAVSRSEPVEETTTDQSDLSFISETISFLLAEHGLRTNYSTITLFSDMLVFIAA